MKVANGEVRTYDYKRDDKKASQTGGTAARYFTTDAQT